MKGVSFSNYAENSNEIPVNHHNEKDFERVSSMGFNCVRFYLNYKTFEDDSNPYIYKKSAWEWLDKNISWAKKHNVYLTLYMHKSVKNQNSRNENLWRAIAKKYAMSCGAVIPNFRYKIGIDNLASSAQLI